MNHAWLDRSSKTPSFRFDHEPPFRSRRRKGHITNGKTKKNNAQTLHGTAIYDAYIGVVRGVNVAIYGSPMECLGRGTLTWTLKNPLVGRRMDPEKPLVGREKAAFPGPI